MMFGKTERKIILSKINLIQVPAKTQELPAKIFFTIAYDIVKSDKSLFITDLGCTIIFPTQEYRVVARSSVEITEDETMNTSSLRIKSEEEIPALEGLINDDIIKHKNNFTISHIVKSDFTAEDMEDAISDALGRVG